jgi:hypothetical protein
MTLLPEVLDTPIRETAEALNLPVEAYYLALLSVAASCLPSQTRLVIDPSTGYEVPPVLWGGLVGDEDSTRLILDTLIQPLKDLQEEYHQRYQQQLKEYKAARRKRKKKRGFSSDCR